jgi:hypothetical protein
MNVIEIRNKLIEAKFSGEQADAIIMSQTESLVTKDYLDATLATSLAPLKSEQAAIKTELMYHRIAFTIIIGLLIGLYFKR